MPVMLFVLRITRGRDNDPHWRTKQSKVTSKMASSKRVLYVGKKSIKIIIKMTNPSFLHCASLTLQPRACLGMLFRLSAVARKGAKDEILARIARSMSF